MPPFLRGKGQGWVTAEYGMLPRSTHTRSAREAAKGKQSGRTQEIQRLIGRSLRAVTDLKALGERQITLDCDVLQADGGTRCASITGAWLALYEACEKLVAAGKLPANPMRDHVAAISVGIYKGVPVLDLDYPEDSDCDTDMNVVMTGSGGIVELQGTAEGEPFTARADGPAGRPRRSRHRRTDRPHRRRRSPHEARPRLEQRQEAQGTRAILAPLGWELIPQEANSAYPECRRAALSPLSKTRWPRRATRRAAPACRRWPTTPGCASMRSAAPPAFIRRALCRRAEIRCAQQ